MEVADQNMGFYTTKNMKIERFKIVHTVNTRNENEFQVVTETIFEDKSNFRPYSELF